MRHIAIEDYFIALPCHVFFVKPSARFTIEDDHQICYEAKHFQFNTQIMNFYSIESCRYQKDNNEKVDSYLHSNIIIYLVENEYENFRLYCYLVTVFYFHLPFS